MYLYLGGDAVVNDKNIIGIFDLDTATVSKKTRDYINHAEKSGETVYTSYDLPKTFAVCASKNCKNKVYITAVSTQTIQKRTQNNE